MVQGYPDDWDDRRKAVYQRDGYACQMCGIGGGKKGGARLEAHHLMPKSKDGQHHLRNLLTLCSYCHDRIDYFKESPRSPRSCLVKSVPSPVACEAKHESGTFKKYEYPIIPAVKYVNPDSDTSQQDHFYSKRNRR